MPEPVAGDQSRPLWARKRGLVVRLTGCFLFVFLSTCTVRFAPEATHLMWPANGVLLAYLLLAPRGHRIFYLLAGFAALGFGCALAEIRWQQCVLLAALNLAEVGLSATLLRLRSHGLPSFTERAYLIRFVGFGIVLCPIAIGALQAAISMRTSSIPPGLILLRWASEDGLGVCVATPGCVAMLRTRFRIALRGQGNWLCIFLASTIPWLIFTKSWAPFPFLLYPLLLLVLVRMSLGWAAMATFYIATIGSWFTLRGQGPFAAAYSGSGLHPAIVLQIYIACAMFMLYSVSVVLEKQRSADRRLQKIAAIHALIMENSRDAIIVADLKGRRRYVSSASQSLGGWLPEELMRQGRFDLVHPEDIPRAETAVKGLATSEQGTSIEVRVRRKDGEYIWVESNLRSAKDPRTGKPYGILNILRDISDRRRTEQEHEFHNSLMRAISEVTLDGILVVDENENIAAVNKKFFDVWRISNLELPVGGIDPGRRVSDQQLHSRCMDQLKAPGEFRVRVRELYADHHANDSCNVELADGRILERYTTGLRSEAGKYLGRAWFFRDITERVRAEKQLQDAYRAVEVLAVTDGLTGLANRRQFDQCLATEWRRGMRDRRALSLLLIDVDLFKGYNDTYGHLQGDACLRQIADATQAVVDRPGDLVARFGGEEFAVILPNTLKEGAHDLASTISDALRRRELPHKGSPHRVVTVSIGSATLTPQFGMSPAALIELADRALYNAKRLGRNRVCTGGPDCCTEAERAALGLEGAVGGKAS